MTRSAHAPLKALVRRNFNRISAPYTRFALLRLRRETEREIEWIRPRPEDRALDVACGPGTLALALAPRVREVFALDIAERMIRCGCSYRRRRPSSNLHFLLADAERVPFPDASFDLITSAYSLASCLDPARILAEMARAAKPAARLVILELLAPSNQAQRERLRALEALRGGFRAPAFTLGEFRALFGSAGLRLVDCRIRKRGRWFRDWARLGSLAPATGNYRRAWDMLLQSTADDSIGLQARRVGNDIRFFHMTATFILRKP